MTDVTFDVKRAQCPKCGRQCKKHSRKVKVMRGLHGKLYRVVTSIHFCVEHRHFTNVGDEFKGRKYIGEVRRKAKQLFEQMDGTLEDIATELANRYDVEVPPSTFVEWL